MLAAFDASSWDKQPDGADWVVWLEHSLRSLLEPVEVLAAEN